MKLTEGIDFLISLSKIIQTESGKSGNLENQQFY